MKNNSKHSFLYEMLLVTLFFILLWLLCEYGIGDIPNMDEIQNLYLKQGSYSGYFEDQIIVCVIVPIFLYSLLYVRKNDTIYYVVRYKTRSRLWMKEIMDLVPWAFVFTVLYVLVDLVLLPVTVSVETILKSKIILYILKFSPILFLFYMMAGMLFLCMESILKKPWRSIAITILLMLSVFYGARKGVISVWSPFDCLHFIDRETDHTHTALTAFFEYGMLSCFDILLFWIGLCIHQRKEYV